jgi:hypothetical protein
MRPSAAVGAAGRNEAPPAPRMVKTIAGSLTSGESRDSSIDHAQAAVNGELEVAAME